jgi:hypothetical protein
LSDPPLRAPFTRVTGIDPVKVVVDAAVGVPVPLPPRRSTRVALELDAAEGRLLDADGEVTATWTRGAVDARVRDVDADRVELELRWPDTRRERLRGRTPEAVEIAERLAQDTRVAAGTDRAADAALRALAEATLPPAVRTDYHAELHAVAALLAPGERPLALAGAMRGLSDGIVLLTDRMLGWWGGGRKAALAIPRDAIAAAAVPEPGELRVEHDGGTTTLAAFQPPERAAELLALLDLPAPAGVDALIAADEAVASRLVRELELVRGLWQDGERGELLATGYVGAKAGALVLTDRRLLWASRKAEPLVWERAAIASIAARKSFRMTRLDLALRDGGRHRFDAAEPRERAEALAALFGEPGP